MRNGGGVISKLRHVHECPRARKITLELTRLLPRSFTGQTLQKLIMPWPTGFEMFLCRFEFLRGSFDGVHTDLCMPVFRLHQFRIEARAEVVGINLADYWLGLRWAGFL